MIHPPPLSLALALSLLHPSPPLVISLIISPYKYNYILNYNFSSPSPSRPFSTWIKSKHPSKSNSNSPSLPSVPSSPPPYNPLPPPPSSFSPLSSLSNSVTFLSLSPGHFDSQKKDQKDKNKKTQSDIGNEREIPIPREGKIHSHPPHPFRLSSFYTWDVENKNQYEIHSIHNPIEIDHNREENDNFTLEDENRIGEGEGEVDNDNDIHIDNPHHKDKMASSPSSLLHSSSPSPISNTLIYMAKESFNFLSSSPSLPSLLHFLTSSSALISPYGILIPPILLSPPLCWIEEHLRIIQFIPMVTSRFSPLPYYDPDSYATIISPTSPFAIAMALAASSPDSSRPLTPRPLPLPIPLLTLLSISNSIYILSLQDSLSVTNWILACYIHYLPTVMFHDEYYLHLIEYHYHLFFKGKYGKGNDDEKYRRGEKTQSALLGLNKYVTFVLEQLPKWITKGVYKQREKSAENPDPLPPPSVPPSLLPSRVLLHSLSILSHCLLGFQSLNKPFQSILNILHCIDMSVLLSPVSLSYIPVLPIIVYKYLLLIYGSVYKYLTPSHDILSLILSELSRMILIVVPYVISFPIGICHHDWYEIITLVEVIKDMSAKKAVTENQSHKYNSKNNNNNNQNAHLYDSNSDDSHSHSRLSSTGPDVSYPTPFRLVSQNVLTWISDVVIPEMIRKHCNPNDIYYWRNSQQISQKQNQSRPMKSPSPSPSVFEPSPYLADFSIFVIFVHVYRLRIPTAYVRLFLHRSLDLLIHYHDNFLHSHYHIYRPSQSSIPSIFYRGVIALLSEFHLWNAKMSDIIAQKIGNGEGELIANQRARAQNGGKHTDWSDRDIAIGQYHLVMMGLWVRMEAKLSKGQKIGHIGNILFPNYPFTREEESESQRDRDQHQEKEKDNGNGPSRRHSPNPNAQGLHYPPSSPSSLLPSPPSISLPLHPLLITAFHTVNRSSLTFHALRNFGTSHILYNMETILLLGYPHVDMGNVVRSGYEYLHAAYPRWVLSVEKRIQNKFVLSYLHTFFPSSSPVHSSWQFACFVPRNYSMAHDYPYATQRAPPYIKLPLHKILHDIPYMLSTYSSSLSHRYRNIQTMEPVLGDEIFTLPSLCIRYDYQHYTIMLYLYVLSREDFIYDIAQIKKNGEAIENSNSHSPPFSDSLHLIDSDAEPHHVLPITQIKLSFLSSQMNQMNLDNERDGVRVHYVNAVVDWKWGEREREGEGEGEKGEGEESKESKRGEGIQEGEDEGNGNGNATDGKEKSLFPSPFGIEYPDDSSVQSTNNVSIIRSSSFNAYTAPSTSPILSLRNEFRQRKRIAFDEKITRVGKKVIQLMGEAVERMKIQLKNEKWEEEKEEKGGKEGKKGQGNGNGKEKEEEKEKEKEK